MPSRRVHARLAALAGAAVASLPYFGWAPPGTVLGWPAWLALGLPLAILGGLLPDWLEPATSPRHRGRFHSWLALAALALGNAWLLQNAGDARVALGVLFASAGYASHLLADSLTRRGLPLA